MNLGFRYSDARVLLVTPNNRNSTLLSIFTDSSRPAITISGCRRVEANNTAISVGMIMLMGIWVLAKGDGLVLQKMNRLF